MVSRTTVDVSRAEGSVSILYGLIYLAKIKMLLLRMAGSSQTNSAGIQTWSAHNSSYSHITSRRAQKAVTRAGGTKKIKQREEDRKEVMGGAGVHEAPQTIDILVCPFRSLCNSRLSLITCQFVTIVN